MAYEIIEDNPEFAYLLNNPLLSSIFHNNPSIFQTLIRIKNSPNDIAFVKKSFFTFCKNLAEEFGTYRQSDPRYNNQYFVMLIMAASMEHLANQILALDLE